MAKLELKQPIAKWRVLCHQCGQQAYVATPWTTLHPKPPTLYCGWCGDREPLVEHIKR